MTILVPLPIVAPDPAALAIETLLYATSEPPQAELTVLTASRTRVEFNVDDGVERDDV